MAKTLSALRAIVRQFLRDEFVEGKEFSWEDDELDLHIAEILIEISQYRPYEVKETLTTTASSKELNISSIEDLFEVERIEFRTGQDPPDYRNCSIFGNTLTMDIDFLPSASEDVYLYCHKLHQLTESSSTLDPQSERVLVLGVTGKAAIAKAREHIDKINIGGARTPADMQAWGVSQLALYRAELPKLSKPKTRREYPKG